MQHSAAQGGNPLFVGAADRYKGFVSCSPCRLSVQELSSVLDKGGYAQYPALAVCKHRLLDLGLSVDVVDAVLPCIKVRLSEWRLHRSRTTQRHHIVVVSQPARLVPEPQQAAWQ